MKYWRFYKRDGWWVCEHNCRLGYGRTLRNSFRSWRLFHSRDQILGELDV